MKIKGEIIKKGSKLCSGRLYKVDKSRTIVFEEKGTNDIVNINFLLDANQYGIYGNEFKPYFVNDEGEKKADILALVIDEKTRHFSSWILDVKKTIGGEDVIYHLVAQLIESIKHKKAIALYLEGFTEKQHIGYITRDLQKNRMQKIISEKTAELEREKRNIEKVPTLIREKAKLELLKRENKLNLIIDFWNNQIKIGTNTIKIESYISQEQNGNFVFNLDIKCL